MLEDAIERREDLPPVTALKVERRLITVSQWEPMTPPDVQEQMALGEKFHEQSVPESARTTPVFNLDDDETPF